MMIRKSVPRDLERMMEIYAHAREFMAAHGNPGQWGPTCWPPEALIRKDIAEGHSYVCLNDTGKIIGTFFFVRGDDVEPTYREITDGAWLDSSPYGVVHRIASDGSEKGTGAFCINWAYGQCGHLRIDTHGDNRVMQGLLGKLGFVRCGTIYVEEDDAPRMAYEKSAGVQAPPSPLSPSVEEIPAERIGEFWEIHYPYLVNDGIITDEEDMEYFRGLEYRDILERNMRRETDTHHMVYFVRDGSRIGAAQYCTYSSEDGQCFLMDFWVFAEYRGNGTGHDCFRALKEYTLRDGARYYLLNCTKEDSRRFWLSLGFEDNGEDEDGMPTMILRNL